MDSNQIEQLGELPNEQPAEAGEAQSSRKGVSTQRIIAIVLASLALMMVLAALGVWAFLRYSQELHQGMFAGRVSEQMQQIREQKQAEQSDASDPIENGDDMPTGADWLDEDGNAFRYRDDVLAVLVMGIDYMDNPELWGDNIVFNGGNADVLALVILETSSDKLNMLYIPRDTMADVLLLDAEGNYKDTIYTNISVSHSFGDGGHLSCELTAEAVSTMMYGIPIQRYVSLNYDSIPLINQALGGLEISFREDLRSIDPAFREGETVRLSDRQLNKLIRYRDKSEVDGAYKRGMRDLKLVLTAMFRQIKRMLKEDPGAVLSVYRKLEPNITTNLSVDEISFFAQKLGTVAFSENTVITMPGSTLAGEKYAEFYPDEAWLRDFVISTFCEKLN